MSSSHVATSQQRRPSLTMFVIFPRFFRFFFPAYLSLHPLSVPTRCLHSSMMPRIHPACAFRRWSIALSRSKSAKGHLLLPSFCCFDPLFGLPNLFLDDTLNPRADELEHFDGVDERLGRLTPFLSSVPFSVCFCEPRGKLRQNLN